MKTTYAAAATLALSIVALTVPYLQIPYRELTLPNAFFGWSLAVPFAGAAVTRLLGADPGQATLPAAAAFPAVVLIRMIYDLIGAGDSHNLWPLELVIGAILGALVGVAGMGVGSALRVLLDRTDDVSE